MTISVVLVDANILFSRTLRDYFLYLADAGAIEIHWSQQILDEMSRNLRLRLGLDRARTDRLEELMNDFIEYALIDVAPEDLEKVEDVDMDPKDRHVLAAALSCDADIVLTQNLTHFPRQWMTAHDIKLADAATVLSRLAVAFPDKFVSAHRKTVSNSPRSESEILAVLERAAGPEVASLVRALVEEMPTGGA